MSLTSSLTASEFDSLAQIHGVVCAFLLSISIEIQHSVTPNALVYTTFMGACRAQGFRDYMHSVLNKTDYDFTLPIDVGESIDMAYELQHGLQERWEALPSPPKIMQEFLIDDKFAAMVPVLFEDFPQKYTSAYVSLHPEIYRPRFPGYVAATATGLLIAGLLGNMALYIAFLFSAADQGESAAQKFEKIGVPAIMLLFALSMISLICMSIAGSYSLSFESPFAREDAVLHIPFANCITYIPALFLLVLAIWAYKKSKSNPARVQDYTASCTTTTLESPLESEEIVDSAVTTAAKQLVSAIEAAMRKELEKQKASTEE